MDSFVKPVIVVSFLSVLLFAQIGAQEPDVPPQLSRRISEAVAGLWSVPVERVLVEWGVVVDPSSLTADASFELRGSGRDGWFGVLVQRVSDPAFAVRIRAGVRDTVAVATRALAPGTVLASQDVGLAVRIRWGPPSTGRLFPQEGWTVRRAAQPGDVLERSHMQPPLLVQAGEVVRLVWHSGSVEVAIEAVALNRAALGEEVRVRLRDRRGRVRGVVTGPGTVEMLGGRDR